MHDSAFRIGELVMQTYCDLPKARILEIGSMDVNGSLREAAARTTEYVGVDLEDGPGVDVVIKPGERLPFDDSSFDLIMASSAFEHDPRFWDTFIEMCRVARPGGHIYVNAPSNGGVHRYPLDCWRFYPDAGIALAKYAADRQMELKLVESFIGKRDSDTWDGWNDFVAIFRRGPSKKPINKNFVYKHYPSYNARTWNSSEMDFQTSLTEDMQLGRDLRQQLTEHRATVDAVRNELTQSEDIRAKLDTDLKIREIEISQLRDAKTSFEHQAQVLSSALQSQTETLSVFRNDSREKLDQLEGELLRAENVREKLAADLQLATSECSRLRGVVASFQAQVEALSQALKAQNESFARIQERDLGEIRALTDALSQLREQHKTHVNQTSAELVRLRAREAELDAAVKSENAQHERYRMGSEWLRALHIAMAERPFWWFLLPVKSRRRREYEALREVGLFDSSLYLARHPDVAAQQEDPLHHYVSHGMREGRERGIL